MEIFNRLAVIRAVTLLEEVEFAPKEERSAEEAVTNVNFGTYNLGLGTFEQDLQPNLPDRFQCS